MIYIATKKQNFNENFLTNSVCFHWSKNNYTLVLIQTENQHW